jgi:hypothetical protein
MEKAIQFLTEKPGLRKESKSYLASRIGCSELEVKQALAHLYKINKPTPYTEFLDEHGVSENDVKAVWIKSKNNRNGIDFSILRSTSPDIKSLIQDAFQEITLQKYDKITYPVSSNKIAIINIFDAHIDKIAFASEVDKESTVESNLSRFMDTFIKLALYAKQQQPKLILFPIGSDFWQVNDSNLTTKSGTPMQGSVHTDTKKMFRVGIRLLRNCIDYLRTIAPVHIIPIKGNHDEDRVFYLTECIKMAYENVSNITIEDTSNQRVYYRYNSWLFGFAHGDKEKKRISDLPSIMSVERRADWSEIKQGIFFLGDIHHEKHISGYKNQDFRGVHVKFLRAVSTTDKWHHDNGYIGIPKTGYVYIYDEEGNEELEFKVNI